MNHRVPIGDVMRALMYERSYGDSRLAEETFAKLPAVIRRKIASFDYAAAERVCPNRLPIAQLMREAGELLG